MYRRFLCNTQSFNLKSRNNQSINYQLHNKQSMVFRFMKIVFKLFTGLNIFNHKNLNLTKHYNKIIILVKHSLIN